MSTFTSAESGKPVVAFGPEQPGIGSWDWVGVDMIAELSTAFSTRPFRDSVPDCDVLVIVKYVPPAHVLRQISPRTAVVFCPIDYYGSPAEVDRDAALLTRCSRIVVHCESLRKYFQSYAPVEYLDHHVKYVAPMSDAPQPSGPVLWTGQRTNLPPVAEWVNAHGLPAELLVLTNLQAHEENASPASFGFRSDLPVRIERWTAERHQQCALRARAALDVKGQDFRQRHKPPAKALDCIASGLPLAMKSDSSSAQHLARMGFDVAAPEDTVRWLSADYWQETKQFGSAVRELCSKQRVGRRLKRIIDQVLAEGRPA